MIVNRIKTIRIACAALVALLSGPFAYGATVERARLLYEVSIGPGLYRYTVTVCGSAYAMPTTLSFTDPLFETITSLALVENDRREVTALRRQRRVELPAADHGCLRYELTLSPQRIGQWRAEVLEHRDAVAVALSRLIPLPLNPEPITLIFSSTADTKVSAPGQRSDQPDGRIRFELSPRPTTWSGTVAIGDLAQRVIASNSSNIDLTVVGNHSSSRVEAIRLWVSGGVAAIETLYGRFPVPHLQVLVFPLGASDDPVPWGEVTRGGGDAVHLYVDRTRTAEELAANWVLVHELSHLLHPFLYGEDAWWSEGIASYYQNVLRSRAGLISSSQGWMKLDAGFKRGQTQVSPVLTLKDDTRKMMRERQYMRVYWSGAAIALMGDVALRKMSNGAVTLDDVFADISKCCLPTKKRWSAHELMQKMDDKAGVAIFVPLFERYAGSTEFPQLRDTYELLGLSRGEGALLFSTDPTQRKLRRLIMQKSPEADR